MIFLQHLVTIPQIPNPIQRINIDFFQLVKVSEGDFDLSSGKENKLVIKPKCP